MTDIFLLAVLDLIIIGFFFLLRPGEHTYDKENDHPFRLMDVSFQSLTDTFNATTITAEQLQLCTKVHLEFTDQKNGEKGEAITHGDTHHSVVSPFKAVRRRVAHLRQHRAPGKMPLHTVYLDNGQTHRVQSQDITNALHCSCRAIGHNLGVSYKDISAAVPSVREVSWHCFAHELTHL